jgi:ribosomal protein S18 acetylase RimI-like enzyme
MDASQTDLHTISNARARLASEPLRHITPLKLLGLYQQHTHCQWFGNALLATMPARESHYDCTTYPHATRIAYPALLANASADDIAACAQRISALARDERLICKTQEDTLIDALATHVQMKEVRALCNFLLPQIAPAASLSRPEWRQSAPHGRRALHATEIAPQVRPLLAAHGVYTDAELRTLFANGDARCHWIEAQGEVRAVALTFATTPTIHEIGSLYVAPQARRQGHARALVLAALAELQARGLTPRYVVDGANVPSIALAQACGLREAFRLRHFEMELL